MTASSLPAALRAAADGLYALEAATGLIIAHASWLAREDFTRFIHVGTSISDPGTELASIDWEAAIRALDAGELPSSSAECSASRPASQTRPPSASATPSPASTTATPACWSGQSPCIRTTPVPPIARRAYRHRNVFGRSGHDQRAIHERIAKVGTVKDFITWLDDAWPGPASPEPAR